MDQLASKNNPNPHCEEDFEDVYNRYDTVREFVASKPYKDIYSFYYEFTDFELDIDIHESAEDKDEYDLEKQEIEFRKCAEDFFYFCSKYVIIAHPQRGLILFKAYKYQRRVIKNYEDYRLNILSKFRQGGLTTVSVLWALWRCIFQTGQQILVVSKTDREAKAAGEMVKRAVEHLPVWLRPELSKSNEHEHHFKDSESILSFHTAEAARGRGITFMIVDEAAFIKDMDKHWRALYPTLSAGGGCCVVSTVNGKGNWYEEMYTAAQTDPDNEFNIIELDFWEHPEYNKPSWERSMRATLTEKGWEQEVRRRFLGSGSTFFTTAVLEQLENATKENLPIRISEEKFTNEYFRRKSWPEGAMWTWEDPIEGHEYIIGVDCASGGGENTDNNCFEVLDATTLTQVAEFYSNRIKPREFAFALEVIGHYYNTAQIVIDNAGPGIAVCGALLHELSYENLFFDEGKLKSHKPGITISKNNRIMLLELLESRLMNGSLTINSCRFADECDTFILNTKSNKPEAIRGKHDDAILAMSLALYARDKQFRDIPVGAAQPEEIAQVFTSKMYEDIKREMLEGAPDTWLSKVEEEIDYFGTGKEEIPASLYLNYNRPKDKLYREFGW